MKTSIIIKDVFIDLDRTIWDFDTNSRLELSNLWDEYNLYQRGISLKEEFIKIYEQVNGKLWSLYRNNKITKNRLESKRFEDTLLYFGVEDLKLAKNIGFSYINNSPKRDILVDGAIELLTYLKSKYNLHIITNGFKEVQINKLKNCNLISFFNVIITSDEAGVMKPNSRIFEFALEKANAKRNESVYIGDDLKTDIEGANNVNMHSIYYNPNNKKHSLKILGDVKHLIDIKNIL